MKLIALHDKSGKILAAVRHRADYDGPVPIAGKGTTVTKVEISKEHANLDLATLCQRFRFDARTSKLIERKSEAKY
jgi:hypothetical protein